MNKYFGYCISFKIIVHSYLLFLIRLTYTLITLITSCTSNYYFFYIVSFNLTINLIVNLHFQIDDASHFIDGSQIYGSNDYVVSKLRSFTGGTLISVLDNNQEFCPRSSFNSSDTNKYLYNSGKTIHALTLISDHHVSCAIIYIYIVIFCYRRLTCKLEPWNSTFSQYVFEISQLRSV